jgi:cytochrome c
MIFREDGMIRQTALVALAALAIVPAQAQLALAGDPANGEEIFKRCRACHQIGEAAKNAVGPVLNGLFGRKAGTIEDFAYSEANKTSGLVWDEANFIAYTRIPVPRCPETRWRSPA